MVAFEGEMRRVVMWLTESVQSQWYKTNHIVDEMLMSIFFFDFSHCSLVINYAGSTQDSLTHTHPYAYKMMKYHQHFLIHSHLYHSQFHHQWIHDITWKSHSGGHYDRNREGGSMNGNNSLPLILCWDKSRIFVCESKNGLKATVRNDCQCKY